MSFPNCPLITSNFSKTNPLYQFSALCFPFERVVGTAGSMIDNPMVGEDGGGLEEFA
jgi:hypothetical protein